MRKFITVILLLFATYSVWAQKKSIIIPGNGHIDVEKLNKPIDLNMDLSKLTLSELRVLRNSFAARQGYVFMEADLRSLFSQTSWYDSLMWKRFEPKDREVWGFLIEKEFITRPLFIVQRKSCSLLIAFKNAKMNLLEMMVI